MTFVSNDPSWWPRINLSVFCSYWTVAAGTVVIYDWALTLEQEIELIWRQRWSLMTVLYLVVRTLYWNTVFCCQSSAKCDMGLADGYRVSEILTVMIELGSTYSLNRCNITDYAATWINPVVAAMLGIIMIARLHAMYQGSRMMFIFLVITFLAGIIACGVILAIKLKYVVGDLMGQTPEELILSDTYICGYVYDEDEQLWFSMVWMIYTVWEVLALCLAVWVAVKHFCDLRRLSRSTGSTIGDCFRVLIQSHVLYFARRACNVNAVILFCSSSAHISVLGVSCLQLAAFSPKIRDSHSIGAQILEGALEILLFMQMFVLGPRLILSVREYHAKLVAGSDAETSMNSIVFQERVHVSTSSTV
ncbi:uncharacterized protein HD556DRAFT_1440578 [Suillus plorans]|uniref:DUF6533 domain-containing protein n=1 Tax=Suillus plorans TaxID=116603 RepID=A0A9P7J011_9AGAM|nr:uncharacterized protein HD556DRAFT_1440578 [Suillus plorans]KAG1798238.1 hypothetical protein HD556DRAFT_1440578 [Suillus plorans]